MAAAACPSGPGGGRAGASGQASAAVGGCVRATLLRWAAGLLRAAGRGLLSARRLHPDAREGRWPKLSISVCRPGRSMDTGAARPATAMRPSSVQRASTASAGPVGEKWEGSEVEVGGKGHTRALGVGRARAAAAPGRAEAALLRERCRALQSRHCRAVTADATCNERGGRRCARERRRSPRRRRCCSRRARRLRRGSRRSAPPTARRRTSRSTA